MSSKIDMDNLINKINAGERFSFDEGCSLFRDTNLANLQQAADHARKLRAGDNVHFIVNKHLYYSNICAWQCKFCAFGKKSTDSDAYIRTPEELLAEIDQAPDLMEVRITGGVNKHANTDYFCSLFSLIKQKYPNIHIEALAPTEIDFIANIDSISPKEVLSRFKDAGLGSLAAGGAEVASPRVREIICPNKSPFSTWLSVSREAHGLGIPSNASILYGHVETIEERIEHLMKIRELQDETHGFNAFIPLKYIKNAGSGIEPSITDSAEDLRMFAVSRLMLDNFKHIKVLWLFNGADFSLSALNYGANDVGGTVYEAHKGVARSAGSGSDGTFTKDEIVKLIKESGKHPFERGILYEGKTDEL